MDFDAYLRSKKIDSTAFRRGEPTVWESWRVEFEKISPASFTAQKLFLINPIRRKYTLTSAPDPAPAKSEVQLSGETNNPGSANPPPAKKPAAAKPVMKPKPKIQ